MSFERTKTGFFFRQYPNNSPYTGIYQLAFVPNEVAPYESRKVNLILDLSGFKNTAKQTQFFSELKNSLLLTLSAQDSIRIISSLQSTAQLTAVTSVNLDSLFADPSQLLGSNISTLELLKEISLFNGVENVVVSDNNTEANSSDATTAWNTIKSSGYLTSPVSFMHIIDQNEPYYFVDGMEYQANEFLFEQVATTSTGNYFKVHSTNTYAHFFFDLFQQTGKQIASLNISATSNGFGTTLSERIISEFPLSINHAYMETGLYTSENDYTFTFSNLTEESFDHKFENAVSIYPSDSIYEKVYYGLTILEYEKDPSNPQIKNLIDELSFTHSILSSGTAFLALEYTLSNAHSFNDYWVCLDCDFITDTTYTTTKSLKTEKIDISPNPFTHSIRIDGISSTPYSFVLKNLNGQVIMTAEASINELLDFSFLPAGVYFIELTTKNITYTRQIVKQ